MREEELDEIKTLIEDLKKKLLKAGTIESRVYDLCDGAITQDIATKIQKIPEYVNAVVGTLRRKGLVRAVNRGGNKVHEQRFWMVCQ
jgi:hypothetical protein